MLFLVIYLFLHIPAIILLVTGLKRLKTNSENAKNLLILAGIYFLIGGGICGMMFR